MHPTGYLSVSAHLYQVRTPGWGGIESERAVPAKEKESWSWSRFDAAASAADFEQAWHEGQKQQRGLRCVESIGIETKWAGVLTCVGTEARGVLQ